jgi:serine protease Do
MKAGLQTQDILLDLNNQPINVRFPEEIAAARKRIAELPIGKPATLQIQRSSSVRQANGEYKRVKTDLTLTVTPERLQGAVGEEQAFATWGLSARQVTRAYANEEQFDDDNGVVVTTLSPGLAAAKAELQSGDVIRSVNGVRTDTIEAFAKQYKKLIDGKKTRVLVSFVRGRGERSTVLKVDFESPAITTHPATTQPEAPASH